MTCNRVKGAINLYSFQYYFRVIVVSVDQINTFSLAKQDIVRLNISKIRGLFISNPAGLQYFIRTF